MRLGADEVLSEDSQLPSFDNLQAPASYSGLRVLPCQPSDPSSYTSSTKPGAGCFAVSLPRLHLFKFNDRLGSATLNSNA